MNRCLIVSALLLVGLVGCEKKAPPPALPKPKVEAAPAPQAEIRPGAPAGADEGATAGLPVATPVTGRDVKSKVGEAAQTTGKYVGQKKDELLAAAREKLDQLEAKTADLRKEMAEKKGDWSEEAKAKWEEAMADLEVQKKEAGERWNDLKSGSAEKWEEARVKLDKAMEKAGGLLAKLKGKVSGKDVAVPVEEPSK